VNGISPPPDFAGRQGAALVLGGSGGRGAAITRLLAERGSAVALTHRRDSPRVAEMLALPTRYDFAAWPPASAAASPPSGRHSPR
jgi:NAD(P)-dependent dehydrogenase (short-subunit alcohol dehydrogenase family)